MELPFSQTEVHQRPLDAHEDDSGILMLMLIEARTLAAVLEDKVGNRTDKAATIEAMQQHDFALGPLVPSSQCSSKY